VSDVETMRAALERASRHRGRVRLRYGSVPYVLEVTAVDGDLITGVSREQGALRFRLERVTEVVELPSDAPLF